MIRHFLFPFFALAFSSITEAADIMFRWDANPAVEQITQYKFYELTGTIWASVGQPTAGTQITLTGVTPGVHSYAVTAVNAWSESPRSNTVVTPPSPTAPKNLTTFTVTVTVP